MILKRNLLLGLIIMIFFGCNSTKMVTNKIERFVCLNPVVVQAQMKGYELTIPSTWCSYISGFHDILSHSPKSLLNLKDNYYKNELVVSAYNNDSYKSKDIEEALSKHYVLINNGSEFAPVYNSDIHEMYGKYYILKHKSIQNGEKLLNLEALFNYKNQDYIINYSVLEKDYDMYIDTVMKIIASFKIKE